MKEYIKITTLETSKNIPRILNNQYNFDNGKFISNTILNGLEKLIKE